MIFRISLIVLLALFVFWGCSGDSTDNKTPSLEIKPSKTTADINNTKPTEANSKSPVIQGLHPDLHVSGAQSNHVSGAVLQSEHMSGK